MQRDSSSSARNKGPGPERDAACPGRNRMPVHAAICAGFLLLLAASWAVPPVAALDHHIAAGRYINHAQAAGISPGTDAHALSTMGGAGSGGQSPAQIIAASPTPVLPRETRTPVQVQLVERRLTNVELRTIFLILVAICGLAIVLFLVLRHRNSHRDRRGSKPVNGAAPVPETPSRATVVDSSGERQEEAARSGDSPVRFPPSLERKFTHAEFIGEGGLARVFRAQNAKTGTVVAIKVPVKFDETTGTHFTRDIILWQGLCHQNIIRMYSSNILPVPYIEMEYAPSSLAAMKFPVSEEKAVAIITGIAHGLSYAHGMGVVHRDIKPENVLIASDGTPKITDWGLGKAIGDPRQSVMISFSPAYAAPEQIAPQRFGKPGPRTDIYQLGVLLFEMLTGTVPFGQEGFSDMNQAILSDEPAVPDWVGNNVRKIRSVIARCLRKRPEDRYASVAEFLADLESPDT